MVSLLNNTAHSRGSYGFTDDRVAINAGHSDDDDLIVDHIELVSGPEMTNKPIKTTWAIVLAKIIYIALGVSAYIIPQECDTDHKCGEDALSLTLYIHGGMWFTLFLLDRYFHLKHEESRLQGYLDFYRKTQNIRRMPILINSCANAIMVIVVKVLDNVCGNNGCVKPSKTQYIQILVSIECLVALILLIMYLVHTVRFNRNRALPDVTQEEILSGVGASSYSHSDLGLRNESYSDQVMEKQADMIRYLKQHTEVLAKRNLTLTEEIFRLKGHR